MATLLQLLNIIKKSLINLFVVCIIYLLVSSLMSWWHKPRLPTTPTWKLITLSHTEINLNDLSQKEPVIIYFWGSWCPNCRMMSSQIQHLATSKPNQVISIAMQSGSNEQINTYMQHKQLSFNVVNDEFGKIAKQWQVKAVPTTIILQNGKIIQSLTGYHHVNEIKLRLWLLN